MIATKEKIDGRVVVQLSGTIDETDDFKALIGSVAGTLVVNCKAVTRINSIGVRNWMKYFCGFSGSNVRILFEELPPVLIDQLNMIQNFSCTGEVVSVILPFHCHACKAHFAQSFKVADIVSAGFEVPAIKCDKCSGKAEFDDDGEEFFAFLRKP